MAASYSSFLTTPYYSPVFNTALFDGPFRIYFSQSYESMALKIYHLLQSENETICKNYKLWSEKTKNHVLILIYPTLQDRDMAFSHVKSESHVNENQKIICNHFEEGILVGLVQTFTEQDFSLAFKEIINFLEAQSKINYNQVSEVTI